MSFEDAGYAAIKPRFRGEIWEYARTITLGDGYPLPPGHVCLNCRALGMRECRHFEIETCRQLMGPMRAYLDRNVELVMIHKSSQTLGSLSWDMTLHFWLAQKIFKRVMIYFEAMDKAKIYCEARLMKSLRDNPDLSPFLPQGAMRHGDKRTQINFTNGPLIRVAALNDSNTSSLPWEAVIIDEGWQHQDDKQMQKAMDRTKQIANRKIIIVGRCGDKDCDQSKIWNGLTVKVPLSWACPCCGGRQTFGLSGPSVQRGADFAPMAGSRVTPDTADWRRLFGVKKWSEIFPSVPAAKTWAGLQLGSSLGKIKTARDLEKAAADCYLECVHCGARLFDTPGMRQALMASYEQDYQKGEPTPYRLHVGFWNPEPCSVTVPWKQTMKRYALAKKEVEFGNVGDLQEWYMDNWATPWDPDVLETASVTLSPGSYDPNLLIPHEVSRNLAVDVQMDLEHHRLTGKSIAGPCWVIARIYDKWGNSRQLARHYCNNIEDVVKIQQFWKIPNDRVMIDGQKWPAQVRMWAVKYREERARATPHPLFGDKPETICWRIVYTENPKNPYKHVDGRNRAWSEKFRETGTFQDADGKRTTVQLEGVRFSKMTIQLQLDAIYSGAAGMPKFEVLDREHLKMLGGEPDHLTLEMETGMREYHRQMTAQEYDSRKRKFIEKRPDDHYSWCEQALLLRQAIDRVFVMDGVFQAEE